MNGVAAQPPGGAAPEGRPGSRSGSEQAEGAGEVAQPPGGAAPEGRPGSRSGSEQAAGRPSSKRYRVVVDRDLCQGHGVCESEAPEVFELPKKATTITVLTERPDESQRAAVEAAVRYCPTHALAIVEADGVTDAP